MAIPLSCRCVNSAGIYTAVTGTEICSRQQAKVQTTGVCYCHVDRHDVQAETREAESSRQAEEAAAKLKAAGEARQRLAAERKTLEQAQAALDSALVEVGNASVYPAKPCIQGVCCSLLGFTRRWSRRRPPSTVLSLRWGASIDLNLLTLWGLLKTARVRSSNNGGCSTDLNLSTCISHFQRQLV